MNWVSLLQVPGVPIMYITKHRYSIERLPEATIGGGKYSEFSFLFFFNIPVATKKNIPKRPIFLKNF
jgi:U3 small nucleolar RNA-associated protein 24